MEKNPSGIPVEKAAAELGVPADALRLHVRPGEPDGEAEPRLSESQLAKLKEELRSRVGGLRLDDLAKTALTIEWLAQAAVQAARSTESVDAQIAGFEKRLSEIGGHDSTAGLDAIQSRLTIIEGQSSDAANSALQMAGSIQSMIEGQGRELDAIRADVSTLRSDVATLRSDIASLRLAVHGLEAKHQGLIGGLRSALHADSSETPGKAKAAAQASTQAPAAEPTRETGPTPTTPSKTPLSQTGPVDHEPESPKFENTPATPAKYRVKREIEYNFLLERMGFRRLDSYSKEEMVSKDIDVPNDDEIVRFLGKFELGCDPDEVEMVSVQRGEYQMIQYQRIDKASGIRSWITRGRA